MNVIIFVLCEIKIYCYLLSLLASPPSKSCIQSIWLMCVCVYTWSLSHRWMHVKCMFRYFKDLCAIRCYWLKLSNMILLLLYYYIMFKFFLAFQLKKEHEKQTDNLSLCVIPALSACVVWILFCDLSIWGLNSRCFIKTSKFYYLHMVVLFCELIITNYWKLKIHLTLQLLR